VDAVPAYFSHTPATVSTNSFYWANRLIGALADAQYAACLPHVERYAEKVGSKTQAVLQTARANGGSQEEANQRVAEIVRECTDELLGKVLFEASMGMRNGFSRSDH
jgi:dipeptidase